MAVISYQLNNSHKGRLFVQGEYSVLAFVVALIFCLALILADVRYQALAKMRNVFSTLVSPLQLLVDYPTRLFIDGKSALRSKKSLLAENKRLQYQQTMLEVQLQTFANIVNENKQLKQLMAGSQSQQKPVYMPGVAAQLLSRWIPIDYQMKNEASFLLDAAPALLAFKPQSRTMPAHILDVETNTSRQLLVLDKGLRNGVFVGQAVLDAKGLMGQIIDVGKMTSSVLLISDAHSAVPVKNYRTGEYAILVGTNNITRLLLIHLPKTSKIIKGDILVTSGLGRRYPAGYPVGVVFEVKNNPGDDFIHVSVQPIAQLSSSQLVLLLWLDKHDTELTAQVQARIQSMDKTV